MELLVDRLIVQLQHLFKSSFPNPTTPCGVPFVSSSEKSFSDILVLFLKTFPAWQITVDPLRSFPVGLWGPTATPPTTMDGGRKMNLHCIALTHSLAWPSSTSSSMKFSVLSASQMKGYLHQKNRVSHLWLFEQQVDITVTLELWVWDHGYFLGSLFSKIECHNHHHHFYHCHHWW